MIDGDPDRWGPVKRYLDDAQARHLLGSGSAREHLAHSAAFAAAVGTPPARFLDLGTGAGLPGIPLLVQWPEATALLVDGSERRSTLLAQALIDLGLADRGVAVAARAEELGRTAERESYELVVARAFGSAPVLAECAAGLVAPGGRLVVSEAPNSTGERWSQAPLDILGLEFTGVEHRDGLGFAVLRKIAPLDDRYPRRVGIPSKRPLW
ncbi:MAG: rRNA small subunit methyltransferase [Actinomycetia bacterium]|nr:rRNA small subunit methyltransferase [Actinomycetes bacterium]